MVTVPSCRGLTEDWPRTGCYSDRMTLRDIPRLLPMVAAGDSQSGPTALTIAQLMRGISPAQLAWLDKRVRLESSEYWWRKLSPESVTRLSRRGLDPLAIGLFGSDRNGYVRAAVVDCLADVRDGREVPFLTLRAKDWVPPWRNEPPNC